MLHNRPPLSLSLLGQVHFEGPVVVRCGKGPEGRSEWLSCGHRRIPAALSDIFTKCCWLWLY